VFARCPKVRRVKERTTTLRGDDVVRMGSVNGAARTHDPTPILIPSEDRLAEVLPLLGLVELGAGHVQTPNL